MYVDRFLLPYLCCFLFCFLLFLLCLPSIGLVTCIPHPLPQWCISYIQGLKSSFVFSHKYLKYFDLEIQTLICFFSSKQWNALWIFNREFPIFIPLYYFCLLFYLLLKILLKYSWFTLLHEFLLYSEVTQLPNLLLYP